MNDITPNTTPNHNHQPVPMVELRVAVTSQAGFAVVAIADAMPEDIDHPTAREAFNSGYRVGPAAVESVMSEPIDAERPKPADNPTFIQERKSVATYQLPKDADSTEREEAARQQLEALYPVGASASYNAESDQFSLAA